MLWRLLAARRLVVRRMSTASDKEEAVLTQSNNNSLSEIVHSAVELLQFGAFAICVNNYVIASTQCVGPSMLPTISCGGDIVLTFPVSIFSWSITPQLGDVVICKSPTNPQQTVCKRLLGMPGDTVDVQPVSGLPDGLPRRVHIPEGRCWLQGDNIYDSTDSRFYGPVPLALIQAVVFFRVWPFSAAGFIPRKSPADVALLHPRQPRERVVTLPMESEERSLETERDPHTSAREALAVVMAHEDEALEMSLAKRDSDLASDLANNLAIAVEQSRIQASIDGLDPVEATAELQQALAKIFDRQAKGR